MGNGGNIFTESSDRSKSLRGGQEGKMWQTTGTQMSACRVRSARIVLKAKTVSLSPLVLNSGLLWSLVAAERGGEASDTSL